MYTEPNHHSRNLKLMSLMFILYWLLALTPTDDSIRLSLINYKIQNPSALFWIAHAVLFYFAWRFYLSSKKRIQHGFRASVIVGSVSNQDSKFYKALRGSAEKDYLLKHKKSFDQEREKYATEQKIESYKKEHTSVTPINLIYEGDQLGLEYQVQYERDLQGGEYFKNYRIFYAGHQWLWFRFVKTVKFILGKEDSPDYLMPWVLFLGAITTSVFNFFHITVLDIFKPL